MSMNLRIGIVVVAILFAGVLIFLWHRPVAIEFNKPSSDAAVIENKEEKPVTLLFVGDIMLSRMVGEQTLASGDWRWPFLRIADFLKSADLTFANFENPVSDRGTKVGSIYSFRADPRMLAGLVYAGTDVVSVANNHIWDYGRQAFLDTLDHLSENGIGSIGAGLSYAQAHAGIIKTVGDTRVGYLAYTNLLPASVAAKDDEAGVSYLVPAEMVQDIQALRPKVDVLVVSFHMGDEYHATHNAEQEKVFREAIDSGADLVIGHHPHVVQEVETYGAGYIAYSLGNFIFDQNFSKETTQGLAIKAYIKNKTLDHIEQISIYISSQSQAFLKK